MAYNMMGSPWVRRGITPRLAVAWGLSIYFAYTVAYFDSWYSPGMGMDTSQTRSHVVEQSSGMRCLAEVNLGIDGAAGWAAATTKLVERYGGGDEGWALVRDSAQQMVIHGTGLVEDVQRLSDEVRDEQSAFASEVSAARRKLAEAHRFDDAPRFHLGLVNGTFALAHWLCSTTTTPAACAWTAPFLARATDEHIYRGLIRALVRIRQQRQSHGPCFRQLMESTSDAIASLDDAWHFAQHNWYERKAAPKDCFAALRSSECTLSELAARTQRELFKGMEAFRSGWHGCHEYWHAVFQTLEQARLAGNRLDQWLERESGGGESNTTMMTPMAMTTTNKTGWEQTDEAQDRLGMPLQFVCSRI